MPEEFVRALLCAAVLLAPERVFYVWLTRAPNDFSRWCAGTAGFRGVDPATVVRWLFYAFKAVQLAVFAWWCDVFGQGHISVRDLPAAGLGAMAIAAGQALNVSAFYRLGSVGILYGGHLGHAVPRSRAFPYSVFRHPQYVGVVVSIWGLFLMLRFPHTDWWALPVLETAYYSLSGHFERGHMTLGSDQGQTGVRPWSDPTMRRM